MISRSFDDTRQFAKELIVKISKNTSDRAVVLDLKGDLGAGKTTLVQMIGRELGVTETMQSPTFVIMKSYKTTNPRFKTLVHIDAYRIEQIDEVKILRLEEVFAESTNLVCIEWADKVREIMPNWTVKIECTLLENDEHQYRIHE
ncbi:MAG: tRNA (adenosine(37)-N6)-threonylcarbamoyltransferase complex ATPase subunit type 1 TsaE [Patescibacteria group bacterium]